MAKHTPGPWKVNECFIESEYCDIAELVFPAESEEMYNANLNLISAAPDMLEALKDITSVDFSDDWTDVYAAIAKAEGN